MIIRIWAILALIGLCGCQQIEQHRIAERNAAADQKRKIAVATCSEGELTRKTALARRNCIDSVKLHYFAEINYPFMWIVWEGISADKESAEQFIKGKISREIYRQDVMKHAVISVREEYEARTQFQAQYEQQRMQALQILAGMHLGYTPIQTQPYYAPTNNNPITNTTCNGAGNSVYCTSYR